MFLFSRHTTCASIQGLARIPLERNACVVLFHRSEWVSLAPGKAGSHTHHVVQSRLGCGHFNAKGCFYSRRGREMFLFSMHCARLDALCSRPGHMALFDCPWCVGLRGLDTFLSRVPLLPFKPGNVGGLQPLFPPFWSWHWLRLFDFSGEARAWRFNSSTGSLYLWLLRGLLFCIGLPTIAIFTHHH